MKLVVVRDLILIVELILTNTWRQFTCKASHNQPEDDTFDDDDSSDQDDLYGSVDMQEGCDIPHNDSMCLGYSEETAQNFTARFLLGLKKFKLPCYSICAAGVLFFDKN